MRRLYENIISQELEQYRQMIFLTGPRQVGKTTLSKQCAERKYTSRYLNWDNIADREVMLAGTPALINLFPAQNILTDTQKPQLLIFDELHKYSRWKSLLKGYFDQLSPNYKFIVTGSAKLNVYRRGGDSMMGRYLLHRIHPFSLAECLHFADINLQKETRAPKKPSEEIWQNLFYFGGFPEPFLKADERFAKQWHKLRQEQLFHEDLRDLKQIHEISQIELLAELLKHQVGSTVKYSELAKKIRVSEPTTRQWIDALNQIYYCFSIKPWSNNVTRSLLKEPKIYLWDWSIIDDKGARIENFVACHLLKAVHFWTDAGLGDYDLHYLRDKDKREVDFLITKNKKPWLLLEAKASANHSLNPHLLHFAKQINPSHVLQAAYDLPYVNKDCFALEKPMIVPLQTLLSQLV